MYGLQCERRILDQCYGKKPSAFSFYMRILAVARFTYSRVESIHIPENRALPADVVTWIMHRRADYVTGAGWMENN